MNYFITTNTMILKRLKLIIAISSLFSSLSFADLQAGIDAANVGDFETAKKEFEYLVKHDYAPGMYHLAELYAKGLGMPRDSKKAAELYQKASDLGYEDAMFSLAIMYQHGEGVAMDLQKTVSLLTMAGNKGVAAAQFNLGVMYTNGQGVNKDYYAAVDWYTKAAALNYTLAQFNLALMYFEGLGTEQSNEMSYVWNTIAEYNGNKLATKSRQLDEKKLSPSQIKIAKEKANEIYLKIKAGKYIGDRRI